MRKRILAFGMAVILLVTGAGMDVSAKRAVSEEFSGSVQDRCGLCPLVELELPEAEAENYLEENQYSAGNFSQEEMEDVSAWAQYGTKFIYNQLGEEQKAFWDTLDSMGMDYLGSKKNASDYRTWYGTEFVEYEGMDVEEAMEIVSFFLYSNPQYYFFMPGYSYQEETSASGAVAIQFDERVKNGQARSEATKKMKKIIDESVAQIEKEETELDKEKAAHDLICERVVYDYDLSSENALRNQTIYSVFLTDKTVCAGYSQAMELLCNAVGIDCIAVTSETHEWNMLRINDIWYCVDLTWNDDDTVQYLYFNRSEEKLLELETGGQGRAEHHVPEDKWAGCLPPASRDSGADAQNIGIVHMPEGQTAPPEISIDDYGNVTIEQEQGADIYYTADGGEPSVARTKSGRYKEEFNVGRNTDIKAMAAKDGWWDSEVVAFEWPVETVQAYAGQPFVYYSRLKAAESYQAEGLEQLEIAGNAAVFDQASGKLKWKPDTAQIGEKYELIISAKDHKGRMMAEAVSLCVEDSTKAQKAIVGPNELTLTEGYAATGTGSFFVTGGMKNPKFALSGNKGAGKARWNQEEQQIEIASGLKEGIYDMVLEAREEPEDGESTGQFSFRLKIRAPQERNHLPVFQSPANIVHAFPGMPLVFYVKASDEDLGDRVTLGKPDLSDLGGNAQFDVNTGKFSWTPETGMEGQSYSVVFSVSDHVGSKVYHKVEIRVESPLEDKSYAAAEDTWLNSSYTGESVAYGDAIFLRANRDSASELGEKNVSSRSGNKLMLLKFQLGQLPKVQEVILSMTYICKRSNADEKTNGQLRVAAVDGFEWSEDTATWAVWNSWRQSNHFSVEADAVIESGEYELDDIGKAPNEISSGTSFQGLKVKADVTKLVQEALEKGQKELTLLVNTKEKGEEFFVSREGASAGGFASADASMAPSLEIESQFAISGPQEMKLVENYPLTETDSFAVWGTEQKAAVAVNIEEMSSESEVSSGDGSRAYHDFIAWKEETRQLEIRPGLPKGDYCVTLTAEEQIESQEAGRQAVTHLYLHVSASCREELEALCKEKLEKEDFTDTSWAGYAAALAMAESALQSLDEDEMEKAVTALSNARQALETLAEAWARMSAPYMEEEAAKDRYTPASWKAYQEVAAELKDLPEQITEEELYLRLDTLKHAYEGLVRAADKRSLKALLDDVNALALAEYTQDTAAYLIKMRDEAQKVYENANATQYEVDEAYGRLISAKNALVVVPQEKQDKKETKTEIKAIMDGQNYTDAKKGIVYQVTSVSKKTVKIVKGKKKNVKSLSIPATVKINGVKCSVTEVGNNAFQGFSKLKTVTIGSNVKKIGKKSFYNCRKLTNVQIKGVKISTIKGNAFGKTSKKPRVSFPRKMSAKQKKALKKKLKSAGLKI